MMFQIKFKNSLTTLFALAAFALFAAPAHSQEKVIVSNSTSEPVPTVAQGTTKVAGTILVGNTAAAPALVRDVNAASATHLGRKASEMVSLSGNFNATGEIFFMRTLPDGTSTPFTIPVGKVLIITDVNWQIEAGNPGTVARLSLRIENLANPIFIRDVHKSVLILNSAGVNGVNERLGAGIAVSSAAKITALLTTPSGALGSLYLIGYLAPEE
ncbi:MAG TPA: hypothetical protein VHQ94_22120 [Pyrinomonadaceae bacterium]|jgi:hypothetical protein|nr:hypothetical protein [Pyrinomonadaceae bacterium]